ncbi:hypothetical protein CRI94_16530 [Longibacter salinarum]|uniref:Zinc-finger domain-containing protein n=1 Tax=Longibacter salinarum TaxID=1850348 RepID=A0A2A8CTY1_9BACT|nr:hypothetical protein [Longibacter salinarum]PEN11193.1 hypothetical protein CRI94_16530 [Longibacter salinarum]
MNDHASLPPLDGDDASYAWLDEWLCEYVDGTMDPSLESVFETYVEANPELKAHIEQLNETRNLLGNRGRPAPPSREKRRRVCNRVQSRVCRKVECDMLRQQESLADLVRDHSRAALGIASSMAVALVVGIFTGALLFAPESDYASRRTVSTAPSAAMSGGSYASQPVSSRESSSPSTQEPIVQADAGSSSSTAGAGEEVTYNISASPVDPIPSSDAPTRSSTWSASTPTPSLAPLHLPLDASAFQADREHMTMWPGPLQAILSSGKWSAPVNAGWVTLPLMPGDASTRSASSPKETVSDRMISYNRP